MTTPDTQPTRVKDWENLEVKGQALASKAVRDKEQERIAALRARQEAYQKSLPKDPLEALAAISKANCSHLDFTEAGNFAAKAAIEVVLELARCRALEDCDPDVIYWLMDQGREAMGRIIEVSKFTHEVAHQFHERREPYRA